MQELSLQPAFTDIKMRFTSSDTRRRIFANTVLASFLLIDASAFAVAAFPLGVLYVLVCLRDTEYGLKIPFRLLYVCAPLILMFIIGLQGFFTYGMPDFGKDSWYFLHPLVSLSFGFLWFRRSGYLSDFIDAFAVAGVFGALNSFYAIYINWSKIATLTLDQFRLLVGDGNVTTVAALGLILIARSRGIQNSFFLRHKWLCRLSMLLYLGSVVASFSRTLVVCVIVAYLCSLKRNRLVRRAIVAVFAVLILSVAASYYTRNASEDSFAAQYFDKIVTTGTEVQVKPYQTYSEIQQHWRSFETYRALQVFDGFDTLHQIFGGGFGQMVDLGFEQIVYEYDFVKIPVLHNGYAYVLIKVGILGEILLFCFMFGFVPPLWKVRSSPRGSSKNFCAATCLWSLTVLVLSQWTENGLYNKQGSGAILCLLGFSFAGISYASLTNPAEEKQAAPISVSRALGSPA